MIINASWFLPDANGIAVDAPNVGWFGYANLTSGTYSPGLGTDFWILGLQMLGVASIIGLP